MANINGTNVAAKIVPFTTDDSYATHDEQYGVGGYRTVASVTEMNNIPSARRKEGMLVNVTGDKIYKLVNGSFVDASLGGGGALSIIELPSAVAELTSTSTVEQVKTAFGGNSGITSILNSITLDKKYVAGVTSTVIGGITASAILPVIATGIVGSNKNLLLLYPTNYYRINLALIDGAVSVSLEPVYNASISDDPLNAIQTGAVKAYIDSGGGGGSSNVKYLTTPRLFENKREESLTLNSNDCAVISSLYNNNYKKVQLYYIGEPSGDLGIYPVNVASSAFNGNLYETDTIYLSITTDNGIPICDTITVEDATSMRTDLNPTISCSITFDGYSNDYNGYVKFRNGMMIQWGYQTESSNEEGTVIFPTSFYYNSSSFFKIVPSVVITTRGGNTNNVYSTLATAIGSTTFTFVKKAMNPSGIGASSAGFSWIAIGRWK